VKRVRIKQLSPKAFYIDVSELTKEEAFELGRELGYLRTVEFCACKLHESCEVIEEPTVKRLAGCLAFTVLKRQWTRPGEE